MFFSKKNSNCVGVFGLCLYTTERELEEKFSKFGPLEKVIFDRNRTGRPRGCAYVYFEAQGDAKACKDAMNDQEIDGRRIEVDFSKPPSEVRHCFTVESPFSKLSRYSKLFQGDPFITVMR